MKTNSAIPTTSSALPLEALKHIDEVCSRFEAAWKADEKTLLEDYLASTREPIRKQLFRELLRAEQELRAQRGETLNAGLLRARFPEYADIIDAVMRRLGGQETPGTRAQNTVSFPGVVADRSPRGATDCSPRGNRGPSRPHPSTDSVSGYAILKELGRGGMGVVYLARHLQLQRLVALKVILAGELATADQQGRFRAEALAVARLKHPHLVQIYAGGKHKGRPFLALEYVAGGSLEDRLAGQPQPPRSAARFLEKVARAVHYAHQQGIVHRDLKPANILLDEADSRARPLEDCTPKISDFGLAKNLVAEEGESGLQTQSGLIVGTPSYMAPEQVRGQDIGPATDIFALGVILYEMLTGRPPFRGASTLDTLELVCHEEPIRPRRFQRKCPCDLETICLKCLEKDPVGRYASADDLANDCAAFLANRPLQARPVGAWGKAHRWARRYPAVAALLATVLLVLLAGTGFASFFAVRAQHWAVAALGCEPPLHSVLFIPSVFP